MRDKGDIEIFMMIKNYLHYLLHPNISIFLISSFTGYSISGSPLCELKDENLKKWG